MRDLISNVAISTAFFILPLTGATSPCSLFGPDLPRPTALGDDVFIRDTLNEILKFIHPQENDTTSALGIDFNNTSFSVDIYSVEDQQSLFSYHHAAPALQDHDYGTRTIDDSTVYRIGSISKLLTAYVYLLEVGDASFNDPVTHYVPELAGFPNRPEQLENKPNSVILEVDWDAVTIGALASHMAGIPRDLPSPASSDQRLAELGFPPAQPLASYCGDDTAYPCNRTGFFETLRTQHPVEAAFSTPIYSNAGYQILAYALENMTGSSYTDMLSRQLIIPLGLNSTSCSKPAEINSSVIPENPTDSWYEVDTGDASPAGGIYSSTADLRKIGQSILAYEILSPSQTRRWMKPMTFTADPQVAVGAPWEIFHVPSTTERNDWIYTKGGQFGMYSSLLALLPDWGVGVTVLAAGSGAPGVASKVPALIASQLVPSLEQAAKSQANVSYSGHYGDERSGMTVAVQDNSQGLAITSWFVEGYDMFDSMRLVVSGSLNGTGSLSVQLYPTGLKERTAGNVTLETWRAIYEIVDPTAAPTLYCATWQTVDSVTYGGLSIDEFVIDRSADGIARGITPSAFNIRLQRSHSQ